MPLPKELNYERSFFVKDLLTADSLIKNSATLEYDSFMDFVQTFLQDRLYSLDTVEKIIVPVDDADEARLLLSIDPKARPFLIVYLRDFSKATRDEFRHIENTAILCKGEDIPLLKKAMEEEPSMNFLNFIAHTYGYCRIDVNRQDIDKLCYKYSEGFYTLPCFSIIDARWDWNNFEDMTMRELHGLSYHCNLIFANLRGQLRRLSWKSFGEEGAQLGYSGYEFDFFQTKSAKRPFIKGTKLYPDYMCLEEYAYDFYENKDKDPNEESLDYVDTIRSPFDTKITPKTGLANPSLVSISQNKICNGNPAMIPYICSIVTRLLSGGRV